MNQWYSQLNRPPLTPPDWIFGPVWTILYIMIAMAVAVYIRKTISKRPYATYLLSGTHLFSNFIWTALFFGIQSPGWALIDILFLDISLIAMIIIYWRISKTASILLWPYLIWVVFATYLNVAFFLIN